MFPWLGIHLLEFDGDLPAEMLKQQITRTDAVPRTDVTCNAVERCHHTLAVFFILIFPWAPARVVELMRSVGGSQPIGRFCFLRRPCMRQGKAGSLTTNARALRLHGQKT